ncbi:hypothetical protein ScPMuIL_013589 [Solemya velum]
MLDSDSPAQVLLVLTAGSALKYAASAWLAHKCKEEFRQVGKVAALYLYPVKSCKGIRVKHGRLTSLGLEYNGAVDRHWVVATKDGTWVTQRQEPKMALIKTSIVGDTLRLDAPDMQTIHLPLNPKVDPKHIKPVTIKTDTVDSLDCGDEVASWMDKFLNRVGLRLHFSAPSIEKRDSSKAVKPWNHAAKGGDMTAFTDYCQYMVMSEASLTEVNKKLDAPAGIANFRPNIVVEDCPPYTEDYIKRMKIGKATFRTLDSCTRCVLVTVDPATGIKDKDEQPLKALKTFRLREPYLEKPCLGMNMAVDTEDEVSVGDLVYAIKGDNPL